MVGGAAFLQSNVCTPGRGVRQHSEGMSEMSGANERFPSLKCRSVCDTPGRGLRQYPIDASKKNRLTQPPSGGS